MFPLVPDLISDELNLIVALLIGIAFGFILEQAGFSSSRRLAGLFYGYDFTVLRVFFTAGITAMSGVLILDYFGILDTDFIYINPTYLGSAIVGGLIMGLGFVIGGYCPGTSVCAAAIGKIDAMVFVLGGFLGVFLFAEGYPLYSDFYNGSFLGNIRIFDSIGVSQGVFGLLLIAMAVGAFIVTTKIEQKVNPNAESKIFPHKEHRIAGGAILALGLVLVFLPDYKSRLTAEVSNIEYIKSHPVKEMTADELAFRIIDKDTRLQIIDIRSAEEYKKIFLPGSINIEMKQILQKEFSKILGQPHKKKVFVGNNEMEAREAALLAQRLGYDNISVLCGNMENFVNTIIYLKPENEKQSCEFNAMFAGTAPQQVTQKDMRQVKDTERFRSKASVTLTTLIKEAQNSATKPVKIVKKVAGGC